VVHTHIDARLIFTRNRKKSSEKQGLLTPITEG